VPVVKEIPLTQGMFALVDDDDYERLCLRKWKVQRAKNTCYAERGVYRVVDGKPKTESVKMHREIMGLVRGDSCEVDHINWNGLDNRKTNLRLASKGDNTHNQRLREGRKYKGVYPATAQGRWDAYIGFQGGRVYLGSHETEQLAAMAYNAAADRYFGEFARKNVIGH
jgi:hypothetical protein